MRSLDARRLVLDGEVIALRPDGRPHPFQVTMRRFGRQSVSEDIRRELPLSVFLFDCLLIDDVTLIDRPYSERVAALQSLLPPDLSVPRILTASAEEAAGFMRRALDAGHEGVMVKAPDSLYAAGNRGADWLKVKQVHSLDLVVLAAEWGSGRRKGWLSNLHLGAVDGDGFVMLGKTFKGLTDRLLRWQTRELLEREVSRDDHVVYVRPELVVEIAVNEIQESPQYPAGMALRFARVKRYRNDKAAAEADTIGSVRTLFEQQATA
jgi:DNA ligase-1